MKTLIRAIFAAVLMLALLPAPSVAEEQDYAAVLKSLINPHEQIDDEGYILWDKCLICHPVVPDVKKARSIKDVAIRYEENPMVLCYNCHPQAVHPGGAWIGKALERDAPGAPNHLVEPNELFKKSIELSLEESKVILPMDPKTGKIFCATCHNPHERGLLLGRADAGGDMKQRLRTTGETICQYCHRK